MAVLWMRSTNRGKAYILQPLADNDDVSISTCMNAKFSVKTLNNKNNKRTAWLWKGYPVCNKTREIQKKMLTTSRTHRLQMDKVTTEGHIDNRKTKGYTEGQDYSGAKRKWRRGGYRLRKYTRKDIQLLKWHLKGISSKVDKGTTEFKNYLFYFQ